MIENEENKEDITAKEQNEKPKEAGLEKEETTVEEKLKETEEKLLRSLAEIENQRRRFEKEIRDAFEYGGYNFAKESLSILDNLQRAKVSIKNDETLKNNKDLEKFLKNLDVLEKDMVSIFEKNKIKKINCDKQKFDPNIHQAMLEIENDNVNEGVIVQEIQPGYMFGDRLLRPAFVGISKKKSSKNQKKKEKND